MATTHSQDMCKTFRDKLGADSGITDMFGERRTNLLAGTPGVPGWARPTIPCSGPTGNSQYPSTTDSAVCLLYLYLL